MIRNNKQEENYQDLELLKKIEAIIGTKIGGYIQDQTSIIGGVGYIDRITGNLFCPARLAEGEIKTGNWTTANSDFDSFGLKSDLGRRKKKKVTLLSTTVGAINAAGGIIPLAYPKYCFETIHIVANNGNGSNLFGGWSTCGKDNMGFDNNGYYWADLEHNNSGTLATLGSVIFKFPSSVNFQLVSNNGMIPSTQIIIYGVGYDEIY